MNSYIPNTQSDIDKMLSAVGANHIEDLFRDIPQKIRLEALNLDKGISEPEVALHFKQLAKRNLSSEDLICFLGAGAYDRYIPAVVRHIAARSEFYTAYTPYQAEISQGTLQAIFEYQTMIANLTGMDISNASMYDGATAFAEAALIACDITRRKSVIVSKTVHPEYRRVLNTYLKFRNIEIIEIEHDGGETDWEQLKAAISDNTATVMIQNPNFFGIIENLGAAEELTHSQNALLTVCVVDAVSLAILKSPGEAGADIAVGEGQSFGNPLSFGGPYLGFMAVNKKHMRKLPGRIVGETKDVDGKRGYVLTLQAREQHIRRDKAMSNICSNQALNALNATVYLAATGKKGLCEIAESSLQKAHYAHKRITESGNFKTVFNKPFFDEFVVKSEEKIELVTQRLLANGILGGYELGRDYKGYENAMLFAVTEKRSKTEIDKLANLLTNTRRD